MLELLGWFGDPRLARLLRPLRNWLHKLPDRSFAEATAWQKLGRLLMMAAVLAAVVGPLLWFVFQ